MTPEVIDAEIVDLTPNEATEITGRIRAWVNACPIEDIKRAYFGRVWVALGYKSWSEWVRCELNSFKLPAIERRGAVAELAESGMSNRAIADVTGASESTVRRDRATASNDAVNKRTGKDGREIDTTNIGSNPKAEVFHPTPIYKGHPNAKKQLHAAEGIAASIAGIAGALEAAFTGGFEKSFTPDIARDLVSSVRDEVKRINAVLGQIERYGKDAPESGDDEEFYIAYRAAKKNLNAMKASCATWEQARNAEGMLSNYIAPFRRLRATLGKGER